MRYNLGVAWKLGYSSLRFINSCPLTQAHHYGWLTSDCIVGVSLSETHTSVTALHTCVSIYAWTKHHKFQVSTFKYFMTIDIEKHVKASGGSSTEVEAHVAT